MARNSTGEKFVVGSSDSLISIWDTREFICEKVLTNYQNVIHAVGFSYDDQLLACSTADKIIDIAHVQSGESVAQIECEEIVEALAWHPREFLLAYTEDLSKKTTREAETFIKVWGKKS